MRGNKKQKIRLLNETRKRTQLNRKVLIRKLVRVPEAVTKAKRRRGAKYGAEVISALVRVWEWFDYPCGQRLAAVLWEQTERLRGSGGLKCSPTRAGSPASTYQKNTILYYEMS